MSFATFHSFESLQAEIVLEDGRSQAAEVVPQPGYSDETEESIWEFLQAQRTELVGKNLAEARASVAQASVGPFATSPLLTAIDLFDWPLPAFRLQSFRFVAPVSVEHSPAQLEKVISNLPAEGGSLKLKLHADVAQNIRALEQIWELLGSKKAVLRLDANQALSLPQAKELFAFLSSFPGRDKIDYVEQPLDKADWDGHGVLKAAFPEIKLMLDEPIVHDSDIVKAHALGVEFVKLKLFKQGGIQDVLRQAALAHQQGLKLVLGNGVASWMSNAVELALHESLRPLFWGASEANGFLKVRNL